MPCYVLVCLECDRPLAEAVMSMQEREEARCPDDGCGGKLTNDYSRMRTTNFTLKGGGWPSKELALENQILKEGVD